MAQVVASYQEAIVQAVADRTRTGLKRSVTRRSSSWGVSLNSRFDRATEVAKMLACRS